jgi:hypothetical protein
MKNAGFPEINTFGAMMRFAITLEDFCTKAYASAAEAGGPDEMKQALGELRDKHAKRKIRMEETLRLKLNEVTIEPVSSLNREDYLVEVGDITSKSMDEGKALMRQMEETSIKFYNDCAAYSEPIAREVTRIFQRMAKDNGKYLSRL